MSNSIPNPMGSPEQCAAAAALITPDLVDQAAEVRRNNWDWHPHAKLPKHLSLVAFCDGIWIAETGCNLNEVARFARVADFGPVRRVFSRIEILTNDRGEIPVADAQRHRALTLRMESSEITLAKIPAPAAGWTHDAIEAALEFQRDAIANVPVVRAVLGDVELGRTHRTWSMKR